MVQAQNSISRRSMFSSALAAGAALTIPAAAMAQAETYNDRDMETLQRPLAIWAKRWLTTGLIANFQSPKPRIACLQFGSKAKRAWNLWVPCWLELFSPGFAPQRKSLPNSKKT